jgi:hypothetical protein
MSASPTPTITPTPSITPTNTLTPSITRTIAATPSVTPSVSITAYITPSVSITPSLSPSRAVPIQSDPTILSLTAQQNHIVFRWAAPGNPITTPQFYYIQVNNQTIGILNYSVFPGIGNNVIHNGIITGLNNDTAYSIRVGAFYPSTYVIGNIIYGNTLTASPVLDSPIGAASQIIATRPGFNAIEIEWINATWDLDIFNTNLNASYFRASRNSYTIYYSTDNGLSWVSAGNPGSALTKIIISNLDSSLNYIFKLDTTYLITGFNYITNNTVGGETYYVSYSDIYNTPIRPL